MASGANRKEDQKGAKITPRQNPHPFDNRMEGGYNPPYLPNYGGTPVRGGRSNREKRQRERRQRGDHWGAGWNGPIIPKKTSWNPGRGLEDLPTQNQPGRYAGVAWDGQPVQSRATVLRSGDMGAYSVINPVFRNGMAGNYSYQNMGGLWGPPGGGYGGPGFMPWVADPRGWRGRTFGGRQRPSLDFGPRYRSLPSSYRGGAGYLAQAAPGDPPEGLEESPILDLDDLLQNPDEFELPGGRRNNTLEDFDLGYYRRPGFGYTRRGWA